MDIDLSRPRWAIIQAFGNTYNMGQCLMELGVLGVLGVLGGLCMLVGGMDGV